MTTIILVRHGHVEGIKPERFRGRLDLPLSDLGERQADATGIRIASEWKPEAVYSSPLSRCLVTAQRIAEACGVAMEPVPDLIDIDYGAWQGLYVETVLSQWPAESGQWYEAPHFARIPGGETLHAVLARVARVFNDTIDRHPEQTCVFVAHDSVNRIGLMHALDIPLARYWHLRQDPCCINEIEYLDGAYRLNRMNDTGHLTEG
jgi:probable phosphoglycerate mutase